MLGVVEQKNRSLGLKWLWRGHRAPRPLAPDLALEMCPVLSLFWNSTALTASWSHRLSVSEQKTCYQSQNAVKKCFQGSGESCCPAQAQEGHRGPAGRPGCAAQLLSAENFEPGWHV